MICFPTDLGLIHPRTLSDPIQTPTGPSDTIQTQPDKSVFCIRGTCHLYSAPYHTKMPMSECVWMVSEWRLVCLDGVWMVSRGVWDV